jgi:hypothetical protein
MQCKKSFSNQSSLWMRSRRVAMGDVDAPVLSFLVEQHEQLGDIRTYAVGLFATHGFSDA